MPRGLRRTMSDTSSLRGGSGWERVPAHRSIALWLPPLRRSYSSAHFDNLHWTLSRSADRYPRQPHQPIAYNNLLSEFEARTRTYLPIGYQNLRENYQHHYRAAQPPRYRRSVSVDWSYDPMHVINWRRTIDPNYRKALYAGVRPWIWEARSVDNAYRMADRGAVNYSTVNKYWKSNGYEQDAGHSLYVGPRRNPTGGWREYLNAVADDGYNYLNGRSPYHAAYLTNSRDSLRRSLHASQIQAQYWQDERDAQIGGFCRKYMGSLSSTYDRPTYTRYRHSIYPLYAPKTHKTGHLVYYSPSVHYY